MKDETTAPFDDEVLAAQLKHTKARYAALLEQARAHPPMKAPVEQEALEELSLAIEELNVTEEELRVQNQALRDAYEIVERERLHYEELFALVPDAYIVTDGFGTVVDANDAAEELFQVPAEMMRGKPLVIFVADENRREFRSHLNEVKQAGARLEWSALVTPRSGMPMRVNVRVAQVYMRGGHHRLGWIIRDVSEKQRAAKLGERVAQEQIARIDAERTARRFRALAEVSRQLTLETDIATMCQGVAKTILRFAGDYCEIVLVEGAELRSVARINSEPRQATFADALRKRHNLTLENRASLVWRAVQTGEPQVSPLLPAETPNTYSRKDLFAALRANGPRNAVVLPLTVGGRSLGAIVMLSTSPTPQFDTDDLGMLLEISTRTSLAIGNAKLFSELEHANREKVDFLAVLSHELRTPLTAVLGYADLLLAGIPEPLPDNARENVARIRACSVHQMTVVEQILHFARVDTGADEPTISDVDLELLVEDAVQVARPLGRAKGIDLDADLPLGDNKLRTDAGRVRQILVNLLSNAFKFTDEGAVSLSVRRTDDNIYFNVSDTGIGIADKDLSKVFEPFWRATQDNRVQRAGMGLGLAVSGRLARSLGGEISVQSQVGVGTVFTLRLPIQ